MFDKCLQSYAGKYVPALGYKIHKENPSASLKINLVGLALGDPLIDPEHVRLHTFCMKAFIKYLFSRS